ncbi:hypothetical protein ANANG_G00271920, partial [Anguilla anguilla]
MDVKSTSPLHLTRWTTLPSCPPWQQQGSAAQSLTGLSPTSLTAPSRLPGRVPARISACLRDIQSWMDNHHLKLNPGKTELIFIPALSSPLLDFSISLGDTVVTSSPCAKNLGVMMDNRLSLSNNIAAVTRACRFFPIQHPQNPPLSHHLLNPAPGPSNGSIPPGLLQLSSGWTTSICHQTPA